MSFFSSNCSCPIVCFVKREWVQHEILVIAQRDILKWHFGAVVVLTQNNWMTVLSINGVFVHSFADRAIDLGFVLHGGVDNEIIPGDPGIFVKHIIAGSVVDKKLRPGDRIMFVSNTTLIFTNDASSKLFLSSPIYWSTRWYLICWR